MVNKFHTFHLNTESETNINIYETIILCYTFTNLTYISDISFVAASSDAMAQGDVTKAREKSQLAIKLAISAFIIGFIIYIIIVVLNYTLQCTVSICI